MLISMRRISLDFSVHCWSDAIEVQALVALSCDTCIFPPSHYSVQRRCFTGLSDRKGRVLFA